MFVFIYEDVLGFDVSVGDREHAEVVEPSEDLVGIEFDEDGVNFFFLDELVKIVGIVVHDDVEVLCFSLVGEEAILQC